MQNNHHQFLLNLFNAAVESALPKNCVPANLPAKPKGKTVVIGFGKASAAMAKALEDNWDGELSGVVVTRYGYAVSCDQIKIIEAAHPVADQASMDAAKAIFAALDGLGPDDLVISLISGGGSALLSLPCSSLELAEKQQINQELLKSGANIAEMNCIRRHISAIKGGRLAKACYPAKVVNLIISDVPGDELHNIASGPLVPDPSTCEDALNILNKYEINVSASIRAALQSGELETLKPDDPVFAKVESHLIATPQMALEAAAKAAEQAGISSLILSDSIEGESCSIGSALASIAMQVRRHNQPIKSPCVILSSGETTVVVNGSGCGGSNVECALAAAIKLNGAVGVYALLADSDGVDGGAEIAGAFIHPDSISNAWGLGLNPLAFLGNNDAHSFFQRLGDSVVTGPTFTNVNDFRAFLVV